MADFLSGLDLARGLHDEVIAPVLDVPYAACLLGEGSEVLGFDDARSRDHEWGPRLQLFVAVADIDHVSRTVRAAMPPTYRGYPTSWFSLDAGKDTDHVEVTSTALWMASRLPTIPAESADAAAWLAIPQQHLLQLAAGEVFHDDIGEITAWREAFEWYPLDVWRWMLACQWHLIGQVHPLLTRTVETGDRLGARLLAARLSELMMELAFLQERRYRPYAKWFGRAFERLAVARELGPLLDAGAEGRLKALVLLGRCHDQLGITERVGPRIEQFSVGIAGAVRPYSVLNTGEYVDATVQAIGDRSLRDLPRVGSLDQLTHADDTLINFTDWPAALAERFRDQLAR